MNGRTRAERLMPNGVPRWVRVYDNGGETADRYAVVFTGRYGRFGVKRSELHTTSIGWFQHMTMSGAPYHPQGVCLHGESPRILDEVPGRWGGVPVGRRCYLGRRIRFEDLPADCQKAVVESYEALWGIERRVPA